jgi:hypothetical protein
MRITPGKRVEHGAVPINLSENCLTPEDIYKIYHKIKNESTDDVVEEKFKSELLKLFGSKPFKYEDKIITMDENEKIDLIKKIFDDLNAPDLQSHAKRIYDGITRFSPLHSYKF